MLTKTALRELIRFSLSEDGNNSTYICSCEEKGKKKEQKKQGMKKEHRSQE